MRLPRRRRSRKLIPRFDLKGFHINNNSSEDPITGIYSKGRVILTPFTVSMCTLHPTSGADLQILPEGLRSNTVYTIITDTELVTTEEGTQIESDLIQVPTNTDRTKFRTFWIIRTFNTLNNVIPSCKAICVEYQPEFNIGLDFQNKYSVDINGTLTDYDGEDESWWDHWEDIN